MSARTRWVVLDGNSRAFTFNGMWKPETNEAAHLTTLYTTTDTSGGSMKFQFNGTKITLLGQAEAANVNCTEDDTPIMPDPSATGEDFSCTWQGNERTNDGDPHTFLVNVSVPEVSNSASPSFSIDSVWYLPSSDSGPLSESDPQGLVEYKSDDPHIDYTSGDWKPSIYGHAMEAAQVNSSATILFNGTKIIWLGWTPEGGLGSASSRGRYWIDDGEPTIFNLDPPPTGLDESINVLGLIEVGGLSKGAHNRTVVYDGPSANPLVLDSLLVQDGDLRIEERPAPAIPGSPTQKVSPGVIAGAVVGGLAFVTLALLACVFARRRHKKRHITLPNSSQASHLLESSPPSSATPMTTSHTSQSTIATANAPSPPHPSGIDRQQSHSSFATPHHADTGHNALAGPSTALAPPIYLQAHGVTTNQGDFALAGRDVHLHKHYHWRLATEIDTHITNIQSGDEATTTHLLRPHLEHHLLSALHPNQQTIQDHQPTLIDDSRGLHARLEEEGHVHSAEFSA